MLSLEIHLRQILLWGYLRPHIIADSLPLLCHNIRGVEQLGRLQMGQKRRREDETMESQSQTPFLPMFETFRAELDSHHDRRERCIKASRDITASAKKM